MYTVVRYGRVDSEWCRMGRKVSAAAGAGERVRRGPRNLQFVGAVGASRIGGGGEQTKGGRGTSLARVLLSCLSTALAQWNLHRRL